MIARWAAALAGSACMATITATSKWTAHQRDNPTAQGPASFVGGEYMAASCSDYLGLQISGTARQSLQRVGFFVTPAYSKVHWIASSVAGAPSIRTGLDLADHVSVHARVLR